MTNNDKEIIYYQNSRGIKVTRQTLSTRYKDESLAPIQSVQIGREPLIIGCISGIGLMLFCYQFGDLLYSSEQITLTIIGCLIFLGGYTVAALRVGQYMHEKTVFWGTIWTVQEVRQAIDSAKRGTDKNSTSTLIEIDPAD